GTLSSVLRGWPAAVLLLGTPVLGLGAPETHAAELPRHFDIPAEPLGAALNDFARQADVTLLFSSTLVAHARTSGVHGNLAVGAALEQVLGGTGLAFRQVSPSALAIVDASGRTQALPNAATAATGSDHAGNPQAAAPIARRAGPAGRAPLARAARAGSRRTAAEVAGGTASHTRLQQPAGSRGDGDARSARRATPRCQLPGERRKSAAVPAGAAL